MMSVKMQEKRKKLTTTKAQSLYNFIIVPNLYYNDFNMKQYCKKKTYQRDFGSL